ncbi:MAG: TonB family protein [Sphingomicrobium sp.]
MRIASWLIGAACLVPLTPMLAQGIAPLPVLIQPTGKWVMKGENRMCILSRDYSVAGRPLTLGIKTVPVGEDATVIVVDAARTRREWEGTIDINGIPTPRKPNWGYSFVPRSGNIRLTSVHTKKARLDAPAASGVLALRGGKLIDVNFAVPGMKAALSVLRQCNEALAEQLGMPVAEQRRVATPAEPKTPLFMLFSPDDYPYKALMQSRGGEPLVMLVIDPAGAVKSCQVIESSGTESLDARTCLVVAHAKFSPARDKAGEPMQSLYFFWIRWLVTS